MSFPRLTAVLLFVGLVSAAGEAGAEGEKPVAEPPHAAGSANAVSAGAFLPFTLGAASNVTYGKAQSGYDGARRVLVYEAAADGHVVGGLSVRAGYSSHDLSGHASALFGAR